MYLQKKRGIKVEHPPDNEHVMIALVQGEHGVEFRPSVLNVPTGTFVEWINQTDVSQHVFMNNSISFDLVPRAFTGTHILKAGSSRWQIQSNPHAYLTITASGEDDNTFPPPQEQDPFPQHMPIAITSGRDGAGFDRSELSIPIGTFTIWTNQTDVSQVILPDTKEIRRVMTLAPSEQEGAVWMMRSSKVGTFRWCLQSNPNACITITVTGERKSDIQL